ncbi:MAG TPA: peroxiredoxin family protein [Gemmatimonadales bacterium]|nr:peroxiredoxin family protein [Gemmatimonadales bacterium]
MSADTPASPPDTPLARGERAPDFAAPASDGRTVRLSEVLAGHRALVVFYPGNDTPGCDRQLSMLRDEVAAYERAGVRPLGVNPAPVAAHADYAARLGLPFPLLSDPDRAIARAYRALRPGGERIDRTVYLIDRDGTVRFGARGAPGAEITLEDLGED